MTDQPTFTLGTAIQIAAEAHEGQEREDGIPYIVHPMTVMTYIDTDPARMAAALHDVVEDRDGWTCERLASSGCPPEVARRSAC